MATTAETLRRTNEKPGTRAVLRNLRTSAYKVREVLDLVRGQDVQRALEILQFCERGPAEPVAKLLNSAIANAEANDDMDRDELFVAACFADEGVTMKRMKPRARGRSGRIRKRASHITIIVARLPEDRLERLNAERTAQQGTRRRRVAGSRAARIAGGRKQTQESTPIEETVGADESIAEETSAVSEEATIEAEAQQTEAAEASEAQIAETTETQDSAETSDESKEDK